LLTHSQTFPGIQAFSLQVSKKNYPIEAFSSCSIPSSLDSLKLSLVHRSPEPNTFLDKNYSNLTSLEIILNGEIPHWQANHVISRAGSLTQLTVLKIHIDSGTTTRGRRIGLLAPLKNLAYLQQFEINGECWHNFHLDDISDAIGDLKNLEILKVGRVMYCNEKSLSKFTMSTLQCAKLRELRLSFVVAKPQDLVKYDVAVKCFQKKLSKMPLLPYFEINFGEKPGGLQKISRKTKFL